MSRLYYCLVLFYLSGIFSSCGGDNDSAIPSAAHGEKQDSVTYRLFFLPDNTYGFDIIVNGRTFIHQPVIPAKEGLSGFATANAAVAVAKMMTSRLQSNNYRFLVREFEIDSLLRTSKVSAENTLTAVVANVKESLAFTQPTDESNNRLFEWRLPVLPDAPVKNLWTTKGIVPFGARGGGMSFSVDDFIYLGGGEIKDETGNDLWRYNAITGVWTCMAFIPGGTRISGVAFAINGKGYIGLGRIAEGPVRGSGKIFYEYDPNTNTWAVKASFPGPARVDAVSFTIDDKAYVGSGYVETQCSDFYEYDPSKDKWKRIADFGGGPVSSSIGISTRTKGFLVAGDRVPENKKFVYEYLPGSDKWERRKDFPGHARYFLSGWGIDSNLFIAGVGGAEGGATRFRDFYLYDISKDKWSSIPDYPVSKAGNSRPCGGNVNGKIYSGTGFNGGFLNDWNVYEYYFSVRTDTGTYDETVCYALKYNGSWELYQECTSKDCYAGAAIKSTAQLGNLCYRSDLSDKVERISLKGSNGTTANFILLPRWFSISAEIPFKDSVGLRLFFTKDEMKILAADFEKTTGSAFNFDKVKILQYSGSNQDLQPGNNSTDINDYTIISPQFYSYGFQQQIIVTSFNVSKLSSEFYLALQVQ